MAITDGHDKEPLHILATVIQSNLVNSKSEGLEVQKFEFKGGRHKKYIIPPNIKSFFLYQT